MITGQPEELNFINELPEFAASLDEAYLLKLAKKNPDTAHLLGRLSEESQYRVWLVQRVITVNNALVANQETNRTIVETLQELTRSVKALKDAQAVSGRITEQNDATIRAWTEKFKSPLAILGGLVGIAATATITVLVEHLMGKK